MDKREDLKQDKFITKLMKDIDLKEPSDQFTNQVMDQVMQDWLSKPVDAKKPVSKVQWIIGSIIVVLILLILLGTDIRTIISDFEHPIFTRIDHALLQPIHQILSHTLKIFTQLPMLVYITIIAMSFLALIDKMLNRIIHYR